MRILLIKLSSIGDLVHTIPSYLALENSLKDRYPKLELDWLVYKHLAPTLKKSIKQERLIELEDKKLSTLITKSTELKNQYDYVIDLQGLFKTALMSKIIAPNSNYGFKQPRESWANYFYKDGFCEYQSIKSKKHVIEQNLELVSSFAHNVLSTNISQDINFGLDIKDSSKEKKSVCFIPATTWESKHWDFENWIKVINSFNTNEFDSYITGSKNDLEYLEKISQATEVKPQLVTDKKIEELYEFYSQMDFVIGVDTGPLHIAAAALYQQRDSKSVIGIYGPSSGSRSGPYGFKAISADEIFNIQASNKKTYLKDKNSINRIDSSMVFAELEV